MDKIKIIGGIIVIILSNNISNWSIFKPMFIAIGWILILFGVMNYSYN